MTFGTIRAIKARGEPRNSNRALKDRSGLATGRRPVVAVRIPWPADGSRKGGRPDGDPIRLETSSCDGF
jgi:hypothetical protein